MEPPRYGSTRTNHVLMNRSRNGARAVLEDRSVWRIDPSEMDRARCWPQWTRVRVQDAGANAYWLIAEVLGRHECVLAVFSGYLSAPSVAASGEGAPKRMAPPRKTGLSEPEL